MGKLHIVCTTIYALYMCGVSASSHRYSEGLSVDYFFGESVASTSQISPLKTDEKYNVNADSSLSGNLNSSTPSIDLPQESKLMFKEPIFIVDIYYTVDGNMSGKYSPSVFDVLSYNNTCNEQRVSVRRGCVVRKYDTAKLEEELCRGFVNIIRLAYNYSCFENLPSSQIIIASRKYIKKVSKYLQNRNKSQQNDTFKEYVKSVVDVRNIAEFARETDNQGAQQRKLYNLPHIGHDGIQIPPILIPEVYKIQKTYLDEEFSYLQLMLNLTNHLKEHNLIGIFPYLHSLFLEMSDVVESDIVQDVQIFAQIQFLFDKLNESSEGFERLDAIKLSIAGLMFFFGIILNAVLLSVFICFRETRSYANALLINLTIVDTVSLIFNLLIYYVIDKFFYLSTNCLVIAALVVVRHVSLITSVFSIVALSVQRYLAILNSSLKSEPWLSQKTKTIISISSLWVLGLTYSLSNLAFFEYNDGHCSFDPASLSFVLLNVQLCVLCLIPVVLFAIFSIITSYKLKQSVKNMPGERTGQNESLQSRTVSSNVILGLMVLAMVSYIPHNAFLYALYFDDTVDVIPIFRNPNALEYANPITYNFMFLNSCLNPLALYLMSKSFRKYFHLIISCGSNKRAVPNNSSFSIPGKSTSTWFSNI